MSTPQPSNPVLATQLLLEKLRELVAGGLAFLIMLTFLVMCVIAVLNLDNADVFQRTKDLLLLINPFVGVVIGYYFNKVTSDARAAALQRAADTASATALEATTDRERAQEQAQQAQEQANKMRGALTEMVAVADTIVPATVGKPGTLGATEEIPTEAQIDFRVALERAKRALET